MSAHVPRLHSHLPVLTVGMADFVFLAFFFACVFRFDLNFGATFVALFLLLTLSLFFVAVIGPIPALAPVLLAATRAWEVALGQSVDDGWRWVGLLAVFAVIYVTAGVLAFGALLEET